MNFSGAADDATFFTTSDISSTAPTGEGVLINELTGVAGTTVTLPNGFISPLIINETTNASFSGVISGGEGYGIVVRGTGDPDAGRRQHLLRRDPDQGAPGPRRRRLDRQQHRLRQRRLRHLRRHGRARRRCWAFRATTPTPRSSSVPRPW